MRSVARDACLLDQLLEPMRPSVVALAALCNCWVVLGGFVFATIFPS